MGKYTIVIVVAIDRNKRTKRAIRASLHGGGGLKVGEVTFGGSPHLSCKGDEIIMRDYMDRLVTPPKRVTSPTWGPPPPCKQALKRYVSISVL